MQVRKKRPGLQRPRRPADSSDSDSECSDDFDPEDPDAADEDDENLPSGLERADIMIGAFKLLPVTDVLAGTPSHGDLGP